MRDVIFAADPPDVVEFVAEPPVEFVEPVGGEVITAGRAESWINDYVARVALHRDEIRAETNRLDWLFSTHTTSRSAAELLLFLHGGMMVNKGGMRSTVKAGRSA